MAEDQIQINFVKWADTQPHIIYTMIPNELGVFRKYGGYMPAMNRFLHLGLRRGLPDMFLIVNSTALFIEFKAERGKLSDHQKRWQERIVKSNIKHFVCYSTEEAIDICINISKI